MAGGAAAGGVSGGGGGAISGAVFGVAFWGVGESFVGVNTSFGSKGFATKTLAHGVVGGTQSMAYGGDFHHGFLAAGVTQAFSGPIDNIGQDGGMGGVFARTAAAATLGGTTSVLAGGSFANGAITAAFSHLFNAETTTQRNNRYAARKPLERKSASFVSEEAALIDFRKNYGPNSAWGKANPDYEAFGMIFLADNGTYFYTAYQANYTTLRGTVGSTFNWSEKVDLANNMALGTNSTVEAWFHTHPITSTGQLDPSYEFFSTLDFDHQFDYMNKATYYLITPTNKAKALYFDRRGSFKPASDGTVRGPDSLH